LAVSPLAREVGALPSRLRSTPSRGPHAGDRVQAPFDDVLEVNSQSAYVHSRVITIDAEYMISYAPRRFKKAATAKT